jgi:hypothetical protein
MSLVKLGERRSSLRPGFFQAARNRQRWWFNDAGPGGRPASEQSTKQAGRQASNYRCGLKRQITFEARPNDGHRLTYFNFPAIIQATTKRQKALPAKAFSEKVL